jgi:O-antigen/teichoic acid export membrane protein
MAEETQHSVRRQLSVITVDQAIAGGSNVLIALIAARLLSAASFGLFALVFLTYIVAQGVTRALVCDPVLVHPVEAEGRRDEVLGASTLMGLALAVAVVLVGAVVTALNTSLGLALIALGVFLPLLVLQDLGRYLAFATQRPSLALVLDGSWLALLVVAVIPLFLTDTKSLAWLIVAWAGAGACAGLLTLFQHRGSGLRLGFGWLRYTWSFSWRNLLSYTSQQGGLLAGASAVGAIAGARALGGLQGANLLLRPSATVQVAVTAGTMGHVARAVGDKHAIDRYARHASLVTTAGAVLNTLVILVLPDGVGRALLGDSWEVAQPLLLAAGLQFVFLSVSAGPRAGLLGERAISKVLVIDILMTVLLVAASIVGAEINGALGALWGIAIVQAVIAVVMWTTFLMYVPRRDSADEEPIEPLPAAAVPNPPVA